MLELWSPQRRHGALAAALARARRSASASSACAITDEALAQMRAHLDDIDFAAAAAYERRFRHDVMAHVHAFGDVAPAARGVHPLGATSAYVTDNADLILMRARPRSCCARKIVARAARARRRSRASGAPSRRSATRTCSRRSSTTVGKRATLWMQDLVLDLADLDHSHRDAPAAAA